MTMTMVPQNDDIDQPLSEINVTPLVDVMLVLLTIFIIVAPFFAQSLRVELPRVSAQANHEPAIATLTLHSNGDIELGGKGVGREQLVAELAMLCRQQPEVTIRFEADAGAPYQRVAELISAVERSGIHRLALATQSPS